MHTESESVQAYNRTYKEKSQKKKRLSLFEVARIKLCGGNLWTEIKRK